MGTYTGSLNVGPLSTENTVVGWRPTWVSIMLMQKLCPWSSAASGPASLLCSLYTRPTIPSGRLVQFPLFPLLASRTRLLQRVAPHSYPSPTLPTVVIIMEAGVGAGGGICKCKPGHSSVPYVLNQLSPGAACTESLQMYCFTSTS